MHIYVLAVPVLAVPVLTVPVLAVPVLAVPVLTVPVLTVPVLTVPVLDSQFALKDAEQLAEVLAISHCSLKLANRKSLPQAGMIDTFAGKSSTCVLMAV